MRPEGVAALDLQTIERSKQLRRHSMIERRGCCGKEDQVLQMAEAQV
jgi:hypothetical protein